MSPSFDPVIDTLLFRVPIGFTLRASVFPVVSPFIHCSERA